LVAQAVPTALLACHFARDAIVAHADPNGSERCMANQIIDIIDAIAIRIDLDVVC
jgi:hypothetical protein